MNKGYLVMSMVLSAVALLLLGGVSVAADQVSVMSNQGTDYRALEEQGLELEPLIDNSGNNGSVPAILCECTIPSMEHFSAI